MLRPNRFLSGVPEGKLGGCDITSDRIPAKSDGKSGSLSGSDDDRLYGMDEVGELSFASAFKEEVDCENQSDHTSNGANNSYRWVGKELAQAP